MRRVLTSLLITVALGVGANAIFACGNVVTVDGQPMTAPQTNAVLNQFITDLKHGEFPSTQQAYNEVVAKGQMPGLPPQAQGPGAPAPGVAPAPAAAPAPPAPPPVVVVSTTTSTSTAVLQDFNHDPTSDLIVPQIDLVPDLQGAASPEGAPRAEVM